MSLAINAILCTSSLSSFLLYRHSSSCSSSSSSSSSFWLSLSHFPSSSLTLCYISEWLCSLLVRRGCPCTSTLLTLVSTSWQIRCHLPRMLVYSFDLAVIPVSICQISILHWTDMSLLRSLVRTPFDRGSPAMPPYHHRGRS